MKKDEEGGQMKRLVLFSLFFLLGLVSVTAQTDSVWVFSGKVIDAKTHKAMAYVSVTDRGTGTVTNADGEFTLKLKNKPTAVSFSCLGYKTRKLSPSDFKQKGAMEATAVVRMSPSSVVLSEIIVERGDAREILKKAIYNIDKNYPRVPNLLRGFYRETVQKRQRFISISEGVVDLYKTSYKREDWRDGVAILKGRRLLSMKSGDTLGVKLQGGPVLPIELDVVKMRSFLLNDEELNNYEFSFRIPEKTDQQMQYVIEMRPRLIMPYALYYGRFYIDQETLAFKRIELELDMRDTQKATSVMLMKKPLGLRFTPRELSLVVDYKTDDSGVTRINYIRNTMRFRCDWKRKVFKSNFIVTAEMVVTDINDKEGIKPIKGHDTFYRRDKFYDKVIFFKDPDFWGNENIIEPTEDLLDGIEKIKRKLR